MVTPANNLNMFLREMERQYPKSGIEADRLRLRIAEAAARGNRRGRARARRDFVSALLVGTALVLACVLAGSPGSAPRLSEVVALAE